jgi:hypothetical protein
MPFLWQRYSRRYKGVVMNTDIEPAAAALGDRNAEGVVCDACAGPMGGRENPFGDVVGAACVRSYRGGFQ